MDITFILLLIMLIANIFLAILYRSDPRALGIGILNSVICAVMLFR